MAFVVEHNKLNRHYMKWFFRQYGVRPHDEPQEYNYGFNFDTVENEKSIRKDMRHCDGSINGMHYRQLKQHVPSFFDSEGSEKLMQALPFLFIDEDGKPYRLFPNIKSWDDLFSLLDLTD